MTYNPNFNDKRVIARTKSAIEFVSRVFKKKNAIIMLSQENIDSPNHFGCSKNPLSKYLRGVLLECTDNWFNPLTGKSKKYKLNHLGLRYLTEVLEGTTKDDWTTYRDHLNKQTHTLIHNSIVHLKQADELFDQYIDQIQSGDFIMNKIGHREYHRLQQIPRDIRRVKFAQQGYVHDYDIETAAPSLLLQRAKKEGLTKQTPVIDYFLENKVLIRNLIASDCGIDYQQAKKVITALFQGGILSTWKDNKVYREILNYNSSAMKTLQEHCIIKELQTEIRLMWNAISKNIERGTYQRKDGKVIKKKVTGTQKATVYQETEEEVMKSVKKFLKRDKGLRFITEHDGWRTDKMIDVNELRSYVRRMTGYMINVDYSNYSS